MRKVVNVDEMISTARYEMDRAKKYLSEGNYELYFDLLKRVDGMVSLITITSIKDTENWDKEWEKIHDMICK